MTETVTQTFSDLSKQIADRFIQTVVFLDERADYEVPRIPHTLTTPTRSSSTPENVKSETEPDNSLHFLNAKKVIDIFASRGKVCAVIKPNESDDVLGVIKNAAKRADVLILDWDIYHDSGERTLKVINGLLSEDLKSSGLKLIIIYTGENDLHAITERIKGEITLPFLDNGHCTLTKDYFRIAIFAKQDVVVVDTLKDRVLNLEQLADQISIEFAKITAGLISNVALNSLSILRDNTHLILSKLGPEIDPAYLSHRALLPNPNDAINQAVNIVISELHSLLENYEAGEVTDINAIRAWLKIRNQNESEYSIQKNSDHTSTVSFEEVVAWQRQGVENSTWYKTDLSNTEREKFSKKGGYQNLTKVFCIEGEDAQSLDGKFSILTSQRNHYGILTNRPVLTLGTIVFEEESGDYLLCIQPKCDCVRLSNDTDFFFLKLKESDDNFDIVVSNEGTLKKFKIQYKLSKLVSYKFKPGEGESVIKTINEGSKFYMNSSCGKKFQWLTELKPEHAQKISHSFGAHISRVGIDESEWQRRFAKGE